MNVIPISIASVAPMRQEAIVAVLKDLIPSLYAEGNRVAVEAVSSAIDRLDWAHLSTAPRDGSTVLVAFAGGGDWPPYIQFARWIVPEAGVALTSQEEKLLEAYGGWWGSGRGRPHRHMALAWLPRPEVPTSPITRDPDTAAGCSADPRLYAQEKAA